MCSFSLAQSFRKPLFKAGADTCANTTSQDSLDWRIWASGGSATAWTTLTDYITGAEKAAGTTVAYPLANESTWTWADFVQLRIRSQADTITSDVFNIGLLRGAVTVFVTPDTSSTKTYYGGSKIGGN